MTKKLLEKEWPRNSQATTDVGLVLEARDDTSLGTGFKA